MKWIYYFNLQNLDLLDFILNEFDNKKYKEEELEKTFAESIIKIRENKNGIFNIILNDINEINEGDREYKINDEKSFIYIFICKVKYIFYKFKIRNGICHDTDLEELKDDKTIIVSKEKKCIATILKEEKCHFLEIKVYLLIAEWYLQKYNNYGDMADKEIFYEYLNFAFYMANFYNEKKINEYMNNLAEKKYEKYEIIKKEEDESVYENILEKLKILCKKYNYEFKDTNLQYYINIKEQNFFK